MQVDVPRQPTDTSCGPTCLHAIYKYYGDDVSIERLIAEVEPVEGGGTLGVSLGLHALQRGYDATIYTFNLRVFDPTWFVPKPQDLAAKLLAQSRVRSGKRRDASRKYLEFVRRGGRVKFQDLTAALIRKLLRAGTPVLTGLSATFLYRSCREENDTCEENDIGGDPYGHFVVLTGYHGGHQTVAVSDPYENPFSPGRRYDVPIERLVNAILLGVLTYDGLLLIISPKTGS